MNKENGIVEIASHHSVGETISRLNSNPDKVPVDFCIKKSLDSNEVAAAAIV
jgi:hypothetical protein